MRKCERGGKATVLNNNSCHWIEVIGGAERGGHCGSDSGTDGCSDILEP